MQQMGNLGWGRIDLGTADALDLTDEEVEKMPYRPVTFWCANVVTSFALRCGATAQPSVATKTIRIAFGSGMPKIGNR